MMKLLSLLILFLLVSCQVKKAEGEGVIDGHIPTTHKFTATTPLNITYIPGQTIPFTLTYPKAVNVTGSPRLTITIGTTTRTADYVSGSGSSALLFNYVVQAGDEDANGIALAAAVDLNGGTLMHDVTENCSTTITLPILTSVLVDSTAPNISLATAPSNGTYISGGILNFTFKFSEKVNVTGTPRLPINLTSGIVNANYFSGTGTDTLTFRYTVTTSDVDADGIAMLAFDLNGGTIKDAVLNSANLTYTAPNTTAVLVAGNTPAITSLTAPANGRYTTGQQLNFTVNYDQAVFVTLTPRMAITTQNGTAYANYVSGGGTNALVFRYTVAAGDFDTNGISLTSPLQPNGGAIQNITMSANAQLTFVAPNTAGINVDGLDPVIATVTPPIDGWHVLGNNLNFTVNYSTPVVITGTPKISLTIGSTAYNANYLSGSGTSALVFRYTVAAGNLDVNGIQATSPIDLSGGTIKDIFGDNATLTFTPPSTTGVLVDALLPSISTVTAPADATYFNGSNVDFAVTFDENVTVTGSPSIALAVGVAGKTAVYTSGSGSNVLVFRYVVGIGDLDTDGISVASPLVLNGGTISDVAGNILASLSFTPPTTAGILVDGTVASISSITPPADATYKTSNNVDFVVNFSRAVDVTGTPRIQLDVDGTTVYANYLSGSATSSLTFRYIVQANHKDTNGLTVVAPLELNSGTIQDSSSNNAILAFTPPTTTGVVIDGVDLTIASITAPADKDYILNENMDFTVVYNNSAIVTGIPRIQLTVGAATLYATYVSGSGSANLLFRYTVGTGDVDTDGISTVGPSLDLNSGTIKDEFTDNAALAFTAANYPNKKVDGLVPAISTVAGPTAGTYLNGQNLDFVATMSEVVIVSGSPRIEITIGSTTRYANYLSGTGSAALTFRYTVTVADQDTNGIVVVPTFDLNSGTLQDISGNALTALTFTAPDTSAVLVDGMSAEISSVTPPANGTYQTGNNLDFIANFSQPVDVIGTPSIAINVGGSSLQANYLSGSGTSALTFRYTVVAGHLDADGITSSSPLALNGGTIKNAALTNAQLTFSPPTTSAVLVDGIDIVISSITPPIDKTYKIGENLDFTVNFNYASTVTGNPRIQLTVGAATLYATYVSGSGTAAHLYRYTVNAADVDVDGITSVGPAINLNSGTVKDSFGDNANLNFTGTNYANKKVDGVRPTISSMGVSANKTYIVSENINFTATYSEAVTISGSPRLTLTVGATTRYATYLSGSGTTSIVFQYTVPSGDLDGNGIVVASGVDLNAGTISDAAGNAQTNLLFTPPTLTGVLVDAIVPTISSITPPSSTTYGLAAALNFTVNFSEAVTIVGNPTLSLNIGGSTVAATYLSGSGSTAIVFRYTTVLNNVDTNGVASESPLLLAGGTIKDAPGNNSDLTFTGATHTGVNVDALPPSVSSVTLPANNTYQSGGTRPSLSFTVVFSENVTVATGTPRLHLTIGANTRYATYVSGSGTSSLIFTYTLVAADLDLDGIAIANSSNIDLNGATMRDAVANNALLAMGSLVTNKIFAVIPSMRNWYDLSDTTKIVTSGGNITSLNDKIGTYNLTGSVPYNATGFNGGSNAYAACASGDYFVGASSTSPIAVVAVFRAPSAAGTQYLIYHANTTNRPLVQFSSTATSGTVALGSTLTGAKFTSVWSGDAATQTSLWAINGYYVRGFSWPSSVTRAPDVCRMDGQIAELFFFTAEPTVAEMNALEVFINARYGLSFP